MPRPFRRVASLVLAACAACGGAPPSPAGLTGVTPANHRFFPIASGDHAVDCASCHTSPPTFSQYSCTSCHVHDQMPTDGVHASVAGYQYASTACLGCHPSPAHGPFDHRGVTGACARCHQPGASFAALPVAGFTHEATNGADCGQCHTTAGWSTGAVPGGLVHDPAHDLVLTALVPSYVATSITAVAPRSEDLPMDMDHATAAVGTATLANCAGCHAGAAAGAYFPGVFHASLANLGVPQPATCAGCHSASAPIGFVGPPPVGPARTPPSGEMKHDAVEWSGGAPTATRAFQADCAVCHAAPTGTAVASWSAGRGGGAPGLHASLATAGLSQPRTCLDCHASTRPIAALTSATAALPAHVTFDHQAAAALGDCAACHAASAGGGFASWAGGRIHLPGSAAPTSCLPCHAGERPASAAGWASPTYASSPFDYGTSSLGVTHGDGQDCALCHAGPGTGAWGSTQNWQGGHFPHGAGTPAATTCIACHASQRPDLQPGTTAAAMAALLGFDHSRDGTGDCFGCHQATIAAGRYVDYVDASTHALPGGDWAGGAFYPGATPVSDPAESVNVAELHLTRSGGWVTGFTTATATLYGAMSHVSAGIPAQVSPGPASSPDTGTCWHCHANVNGVVTAYAGGTFHAALAAYRATPGGPVTPLPQPTAHCADCHAGMAPAGIVEAGGSSLVPMDHAALFTGPVSIGGVTVSGVAGLDCSVCHSQPGGAWADGTFHARLGGAVPQDCTVCHYPLMATPAADVRNGSLYAMAHRSPQLPVQQCAVCHTTALSRSTTHPAAGTLWQPGSFHASVAAQPAACLDCHAGSAPVGATASSVIYALAAGGTATNGNQWMNHAVAGVAGVDCAVCHAGDAKPSGAAWSRSTAYHAHAPSPPSCASCHGLANGNGSAAGTGNDLPSGLTDSTVLTTASNDATTGVPAGTHDQLVHTDLNVSAHDCSFCHAQVGPSTIAGVQGKEWAQARFHASFSASAPFATNGTTARCSSCHMNVKPGPGFAGQDHSAFTSAPGTQDCASCHTWPGTGTTAAPNWLGATGGAPTYITVGGFVIPSPPASPPFTEPGIPGLPHPGTSGRTCATCHTGGAGGKNAIGYDHASTLASTTCAACHEAGSDLVGTPWNGATSASAGAGDTRPITLASVVASRGGDSRTVTYPNHFFYDRAGVQVDCSKCHTAPSGVSTTTTGAAYTNAWSFHHPPENPIQNYCYQCHPNGTG